MNDAPITRQPARTRLRRAITSSLISPAEASLVIGSALLTILSFPDFDLWFLAWVSLVPLLTVVAHVVSFRKAFVAGWLWGTIFFYGTCWWLTYPMIHYAEFPRWAAFSLLLIPIALVALFPALACALSARVIKQFGSWALIFIPFVWVSAEWLRYAITGQLWNALGYSLSFHPLFIQTARWGGVYSTSFMLTLIAAALALVLVRRDRVAVVLCSVSVLGVILIVSFSVPLRHDSPDQGIEQVVAVQPNVPVEGSQTPATTKQLLQRHLELTERGLRESPNDLGEVLLVIWPESPMNFSYSKDRDLQEAVRNLTQKYSSRRLPVYVLLNSLEPAKAGGDQNSAILVNEKGEMSARYDKIRLMPFGEYVPLPRWLPGASSVRGLVGEFTPGSRYTLMPLGALRAGVFICIEAAHPGIARNFTNEGANVLINISNDGYLGPTPVMRQHLANAVFRAVENNRDVVRVTNTGITALIRSNGDIFEQTTGFHEDVRSWTIVGTSRSTFYTRHGDVFVYGCGLISLGIISASLMRRRAV